MFYEVFLPSGWSFEDYNEYETYGLVREETSEFNKRKSSTHISQANVEITDDTDNADGTEYVSHFCFPFDYQFLAKEDSSNLINIKHIVNDRPYLLFQVNSVDSWHRHRIEGYGFLRLPLEAGYHTLSVPTWRPRGSILTEIHSFFLGGSVRVLKMDELLRTRYLDENGRADIVNRFGLETEDAGSVEITVNIAWQNKTELRKQRKEFNIVKQKEMLETKRRINEFKLKQMKVMNEGETMDATVDSKEQQEQIIHGNDGMMPRFMVR